MGWIKLTPEQLATLDSLSASNTTSNFVRARADVNGDPWLSASVLSEMDGLFLHYKPLLETLTVTQTEMPNWPVDPDV